MEAHDHAALAREQDSGLFWVEVDALKTTRAPEPTTKAPDKNLFLRAPPPDFLALEAAIGMGMKLPRRRREIKGGEIVFLRSDVARRELAPWRYIGQVPVKDRLSAILIDPSLRLDAALSPGWDQQILVPLLREDGESASPAQVFIPAFPLPDGTEDPGWIYRARPGTGEHVVTKAKRPRSSHR